MIADAIYIEKQNAARGLLWFAIPARPHAVTTLQAEIVMTRKLLFLAR